MTGPRPGRANLARGNRPNRAPTGQRQPGIVSASLRSTASQEIPVAVFGHPLRPREMALPGASRPLGLIGWIDVQHDPGDVRPVGTFGVRIEQTQIGDEMFLVVPGQISRRRGLVGNRGVERRLGHDHLRP